LNASTRAAEAVRQLPVIFDPNVEITLAKGQKLASSEHQLLLAGFLAGVVLITRL